VISRSLATPPSFALVRGQNKALLCLSTSLRLVELGVSVVFESRRNRSGERPLLSPLDVAAGRSPNRLRLPWVNPRAAISNLRTPERLMEKDGLERREAVPRTPPNPAAGVGEGSCGR
jgi:hypothetical protein